MKSNDSGSIARRARAAAGAALLGAATFVAAQPTLPDALTRCKGLPDAERLACFDRVLEAVSQQPAPKEDVSPNARALLLDSPRPPGAERSLIGDRWGLGTTPDDSRFDLRPHRPSYFLLGRYSDAPNLQPGSPTRGIATPALDIEPIESKFQLSFKVKLADFGRELPLPLGIWAGYTQVSHWQVYNSRTSRPFRETNYEPELMVAVHPDRDILGWRWRLAAVGINHQSNGRAEPLSRSWNRIVAQAGVERGDFALLGRAWLRIREDGAEDDNPDLTHYLGHGDLTLVWAPNQNTFSLNGRYNVARGKGAAQLHWTFPLARRVRGMLQVFSGYGESLIDYNVKQTTFGLGISLADHL